VETLIKNIQFTAFSPALLRRIKGKEEEKKGKTLELDLVGEVLLRDSLVVWLQFFDIKGLVDLGV